MAEVNIHQCIEAVLRGQVLDTQMVHVLHFKCLGSTVNATDLDTVGDMLANWAASEYTAFLSNQINLTYIDLKARDVDGGVESSVGVNAQGQIDTDIFNLTESLVVSLRTGIEGRTAHGKMFIFPAMPPDRQSAYFYTTAYGGSVLASLNELQTSATAASRPWVVASGKLGTVRTVTSAATTLHIGIQKGRGHHI